MKLFFRFCIILLSIFFLYADIPYLVAQASYLQDNSQEGKVSSPPANMSSIGGTNQDQSNNPYLDYNEHSVKPIPAPHILFKRRVWREIYLKEKKNKSFFARDREITKFIIQGVKEGILTPYTDATLATKMSQNQFFENLKLPQEGGLSDQEKALGFADNNGWNDKTTSQDTSREKEEEYFLPNEITTLELMEDVIFHKVSSTFVYDIQTIKLIIPAEKFPTGLRREVATFRYKDLVAYFNSKPKEALWINPHNSAGNLKLTEAIELRLFDSRIVKIENPDNLTVEDIYNKSPKQSLYASQQLEEELIELEEFLWED